VKVYILKKK